MSAAHRSSLRVLTNFVERSTFGGSLRPLLHRIWLRRTFADCGRHPVIHAWILIVLFALFATRVHAAVHPVPLDKNTPAAKCLECHEEKTKGKSVHSAMATGC